MTSIDNRIVCRIKMWSLISGILWLIIMPMCTSLILDGTYSQFRKWNVGTNGTFEMEFKTRSPNGLLMYTDDGGTYDFFELKIVGGTMRLRYNLGGGAQILVAGHDLYDGRWHHVAVNRRDIVTTLTVDNVTSSATSAGKELQFGRLTSNSAVYVGGMPEWYNGRLTHLALPSVIFEPRFSGTVRNIVYADDYHSYPRRQTSLTDPIGQLKVNGGVGGKVSNHHRANPDACEKHDPCQHGGICISTDSGPKCQCRDKNYEGVYCEIDKITTEASFTGEEFLKYVFDGNTEGDSFTLYFKTKQPAGLLYHMGDGGSNYLNVGIVTGGVTVTMKVDSGSLDMFIKPNRIRFDDNQWHKILVTRKVQGISAVTSFCKLSVTVDEVYGEQGSSAGAFTSLPLGYLYLGGSENTVALPGTKASTNFIGCIKKVEYSIDGVSKYDFLEMGKTISSSIRVYGRLQFSCNDFGMNDPVCLTTPRSFLMLPNWDGSTSGSISVKFRTNEPDGLLFFSRGQTEHTSGAYAVEMVDGRLYVYLDLGTGGSRFEVSSENVKINDGEWHEFSIWRNDRDIHCTVDDYSSDFVTAGESTQLHLQNGIMLGFGGRAIYHKKIPPGVWTLTMEKGFVGCVRDLILDGVTINLVSLSLEQDRVSVIPHCPEPSENGGCRPDTCYNGGMCREGWNRYICDCSSTEFTGASCTRETAAYSFNGTQYIQAVMSDKMTTQAEDMFFRFKTNRPLAMLMKTFDSSWDRLEIAVIVGKIRLALKIGDKEKVVLCGTHLDDNNWHSVYYARRGHEIRLRVDNETAKDDSAMDNTITLRWQGLLLGGSPPKDPEALTDLPSFIGSMQQFIINKINILEISKISVKGFSGDLPKVHATALQIARDKPPMLINTATFLSKNTFVGLPSLKAYSRLDVYFRFKTRHASGLFFYNGGSNRDKSNDFALAEIVNGHVLVNIRSGVHVIRLRDTNKTGYNDNLWHSIHILQVSPTLYSLSIDERVIVTTSVSRPHNIQLNGMFYVGGLPKDLHKHQSKHIHSRHGFEGCMSDLEYNSESQDMVENASIPSTLITAGCGGLGRMCARDMCDNHGTCVEQWNSYSCDCDMTAFVGPTCSEPSISYEFGPDGGMISYSFPEGRQPDVQNDQLAVGLITSQSSGVLLRVDSGTSTDYLQLEIVNGNVIVIYNIGTNDHPIGEANVKVDDNTFHLVRFTRNGPNSTLQVDENSVQTHYPSGHQLNVFNGQSIIQVGGQWNRTGKRIENGFRGVMMGLVFNGLRVLDIATNGDTRITSRGDVHMLSSIADRLNEHSLLDTMQQTPASGVMDDLVYSGAGSGCNHDDEDQCIATFDSGGTDDLITPVYVPATAVPPPPLSIDLPAPPESGPQGGCNDDDEETGCNTSGSGFGPTPEAPPVTVFTAIKSTHHSSIVTSIEPVNRTLSLGVVPTNRRPDESSQPTPPVFYSSSLSPSTSGIKSTTAWPSFPPLITTSFIPAMSTDNGRSSSGISSTPSQFNNTVPDESNFDYKWQSSSMPPDFGDRFAAHPQPTEPTKRDVPINTEAAESTAYVVLVTTGTLIIIVLIILVVLKVKYRTDTNRYKIEIPKAYPTIVESDRHHLQHGDSHLRNSHHNSHLHHNSNPLLSPGNYFSSSSIQPSPSASSATYVHNDFRTNKPGAKKRQDVKEWYV